MCNIKTIINYLKKGYTKYLTMGYWIIALLLFLWLTFFMYQNLYITNNNITILSILKNKVAQKMVDMDMWHKINENIKWKQQLITAETLSRNPFK